MKTKLYDYQEKIRDSIINSGDYAQALFMRMGSGKTVTSLSIFEKLWQQTKVDKLLVICLKNKINDWKEDIVKEFQNDNGVVYFDYEVINFESIWRPKRAEYFQKFMDDKCFVIIDESHKIKNASSKITKYLLKIYNQTKYKLILTGTPQSRQYIDYYPQMRFINAQDYDINQRQWEKIFVNKKLDNAGGHYFYVIEGYNFEDVLKQGIVRKAHYYDWSGNYDAPIEIYQDIEHSKEAIKFQKERVWIDPDQERGDDVVADNQMSLRTYMRQSCSGYIRNYDIPCDKEPWLADFLDVEPGRIVIFVNFIHELEKVKEICQLMKRPVGVYYGAEKNLGPFKENENGIAIVNYASGATGINDLCISNIGIFYSPPDGDHILMEQAKARLDRIGQTKQPVFYYLQTKGSVEKPIYNELKQGKDFDSKMFEAWLKEQK